MFFFPIWKIKSNIQGAENGKKENKLEVCVY